MTSFAAAELKKIDGTRYMAPDGSVYAREKGNSDNYHGFGKKHFVGDSVGDSMPVRKDLNDVKVMIFEYDLFVDILFSPAYGFNANYMHCALKFALFLFIIIFSYYYTQYMNITLLTPPFILKYYGLI